MIEESRSQEVVVQRLISRAKDYLQKETPQQRYDSLLGIKEEFPEKYFKFKKWAKAVRIMESHELSKQTEEVYIEIFKKHLKLN